MVTCYEANACDDGDCLQKNCGAELRACAALQEPEGEAIDTVPPASAPPGALVGT